MPSARRNPPAPTRPADAFWCTLTTVDPSDRPKASQCAPIDELTVLDETIGRLRSRMATGDDSELGPLGTLLLKYLERRDEVMRARGDKPAEAKPGSIAAATSRLEIVGQAKK
jgi:hypothetical protein